MDIVGKTPQQIFDELAYGLPKFDDGRINFKGVRQAPVLNVIVFCKGEILLVKRSNKVGSYQGLWNGISGFIDESKPIEDFAKQELSEELSIDTSSIRIVVQNPYIVDDKTIDRIWIVYPILAELREKPEITLDWEHTESTWIKPSEFAKFEYVRDLDISIQKALEGLS